jgi:hypothetical protein
VQHVAEVNSARASAEEDVAKNSDDFLKQFDGEYCVLDICPLIDNTPAKFTICNIS